MLYINKHSGEIRQIIKENSLYAVLPEHDGATGYYITDKELKREWRKVKSEEKDKQMN